MASYLSSVLTSTTSRYNNLRRSLLNDEVDGDTEDDSHISRVLRAYYVEKGRPFPPWLPPDPKSTRSSSVQPSFQNLPAPQGTAVQRRGVGLSDLWDRPSQQAQAQPPQSLRRSDATAVRTAPSQQTPAQTPPSNPYRTPAMNTGSQYLKPPTSRPLPSQREGSYQNQMSLRRSATRESETSNTPPLGAGATAQDRLKARLWGGTRTPSGGQGPGGM